MTKAGVPPPRTDLTSRRQRVVARVLLHLLRQTEQLSARFLPSVPLPGDDPFYRQPDDLELLRRGAVLDVRRVEARGPRRPLRVDAWQLKFRSTGMSGEAVAGFTTVLIPRRPFGGPSRPLLSYQPALDSLSASADPSYTLRHGDYGELPLVKLALRRGWAVVTTDYNGPTQAFGALPLAGRFILDAVRAVLAIEQAGFDATTPIGMWGYSGGAQATLWAAEQQAAYAPELNIVGVAAGGAGVDLVSSPGMYAGGDLLSGIPFGSVIGLGRAFADVDLSVLTPQGRAMVAAAEDMRAEQLMMSFPFVRLGDHLTVAGVLDIPGMRSALAAIRLGQATPKAPIYLYHAVHDRYPAIADVDRLVEQYRRDGVDVTYRRFRLGGHMTAAIVGVRGAVRFLDGRMRRPHR